MFEISTACVLIAAGSASAVMTEYSYDDGVSNVLLGPPDSFAQYGDIDMLWGNYFFTTEPIEWVSQVRFGLGDLSPNEPVSIWIFDDPDNDADPTNAVPIYTKSVTAANLGFDFNVFGVAPTQVSGGFFVAVGHLAVLTTDGLGDPDFPSPARFDPDGRPDRSWFFYDSDIPETDLASSGFVQRMDGPYVPIQGAFAVRALTVPAPGACVLFVIAGVARTRRR